MVKILLQKFHLFEKCLSDRGRSGLNGLLYSIASLYSIFIDRVWIF